MTGFQLPPGILRNLTRSRKEEIQVTPRNISDGADRKRRSLEAKQAQLKLKSERIRKRLEEIKQQQQERIKERIRRSRSNFENATQRRGLYLDSVVAKAAKFIRTKSNISSQSDCHSPIGKPRVTLHLSATKYQLFLCRNQIPDSGSSKYTHLLYAFKLIKETSSALKSGTHPSFNTNISNDKLLNFKQNFLWVLLYKYSHELVYTLKQFTNNPNLKARFLEVMKTYLFIFRLFKKTNYDCLFQILSDATTILNTQLSYMPQNVDLLLQKERLQVQGNLLRRHDTLPDLDEPSQRLLQEISDGTDTFAAYFKELQDSDYMYFDGVRAVYGMYEHQWPSLSTLTPMAWRRFWFEKNFEEYSSLENDRLLGQGPRYAPSTWYSQRSSTGGCPNPNVLVVKQSPDIDVEDILKLTGESILKKYDDLTEKSLNGIVFQLYCDVVNWASKDPNVNMHELSKVSDLYLEKSKEQWPLSSVSDCIQRMMIVFELTSNARLHSLAKSCLKLIGSGGFKDEFSQLERSFNNEYIKRCLSMNGGGSFSGFFRSENVYVFLGTERIDQVRFSWYTYSPSLLFPHFYEKLRKWPEWKPPPLDEIPSMIQGSLFKPQIMWEERRNPNACQYFESFFKWLILYGDGESDELNELYIHNMNECRRGLILNIHCCSLIMLFTSFGGRDIVSLKTKHACFFKARKYTLDTTNEFAKTLNPQFSRFYISNHERIEKVLLEKSISCG